MKKVNAFALLSVFSLIVLVPLLFVIRLIPTEEGYKTVKISGVTVKAEVADTQLKRIEGLMSKKALPHNGGMLFIFDAADYHRIWMMNMNFSIDILWIGKDLKIVDIAESAPPCILNCPVYSPDEKSLYVLEVNAGFVNENKLKIGDQVEIS